MVETEKKVTGQPADLFGSNMARLCAVFALALVAASVMPGRAWAEPQALPLKNPGFEQDTTGWALSAAAETAEFAVDEAIAHGDTASLRVSAPNNESPWAAQRVDNLQGLAEYRLATWVRSAEGKSAVAAVKIEFYEANGQNISGWYGRIATGEDGTWQTVEVAATAEATVVSAVILVRLFGPGTLWFDDVEFSTVRPGPEILALPHDIVVTAGQPAAAKFDIRLTNPAAEAPPLAFVIASDRLAGPINASARLDRANDREFGVLLSVPALLPDLYALKINRTDSETGGEANLVAIPANRRPATLREDGVLLVDGEPFFPILIYHVNPDDYQAVAGAGFNTVQGLPTHNLDKLRAMLDAAEQHNVKVIIPLYHNMKVRENLVESVRKTKRFDAHPAVLAWKIMDEPGIHRGMREPVMEAYARLKALNPQKPLLLTVCSGMPGRWVDFLDWLEIDNYPLPARPMQDVANLTTQAVSACQPGQMISTTLQAGWTTDLSTQPTVAQARMMMYLAIIAGARGIGWYSYRDPGWHLAETPLWEHFPAINAECAQLGAAIVNGKPVKVRCSHENVQFRGVRWNDKLFTIVANNTDEPLATRIQLPTPASTANWLRASDEPARPDIPLRLSRDGRGIMLTLPAGECATIVSVSAKADQPAADDSAGEP